MEGMPLGTILLGHFNVNVFADNSSKDILLGGDVIKIFSMMHACIIYQSSLENNFINCRQ